MLKYLFAIVFLGACGPNPTTTSQLKYYGADSQRAIMTFESYMDYELPEDYEGTIGELKNSELWEDIELAVDEQLAHMFGVFYLYNEFAANPGMPRNYPRIKFGRVAEGDEVGVARVHYSYRDVTVFHSDLFDGEDFKEIEFPLPLNPRTIYAAGTPDENTDCANRCTDIHYQSEEDHFYFWNPSQRMTIGEEDYESFACKIIKNKNLPCAYHPTHSKKTAELFNKLTTMVKAQLKKVNSTAESYPEYDDLYKKQTLNMVYFVGVDAGFSLCDLGLRTYKESLIYLTATREQIGKRVPIERTAEDGARCAEEGLPEKLKIRDFVGFEVVDNGRHNKLLRKVFFDKYSRKEITVNLRFMLGDPLKAEFVDEMVLAMSGDKKKSIPAADVVIYDGHSGLGGFLSIERFTDKYESRKKRQFHLPKTQYQVFYMNACSTFAYYNADYIESKQGTYEEADHLNVIRNDASRYLDIITTGSPAPYDFGAMNDVALIKHLTSGKRPSWQKIVDELTPEGDDPSLSSLTHVNGDGDNPTEPTRD
jgi:hypothetical protein